MKIRNWLIVTLTFLVLPIQAQKRKVPQLTPEQQAQQAKLERMTQNTQRILFIDSTIVDKQQFLSHYQLAPEVGRLAPYKDIFQSALQPQAYVYVNELGNRCYLSLEASDSTMNLYASETVDNRWSRPVPLKGINDNKQFQRVNYPFMMGDGQTFYFAAEGGDGLGGYDIYVTRYDAEDDTFLHPTNIGMPFNSEANDYMYVIDEYSNLGWFATDRNQPADSVCIYVFEPVQTRQTYSASGFSPESIASFARIDRIADTWADSTALDNALKRLYSVRHRQAGTPLPKSDFHFVINDELTYTQLADFKAPDNAQRYQQLTTLRNRYQRLLTTMDKARDYYATACQDERDDLRPELLTSEQKQHELYVEIHRLEKTIRNTENLFLTKNK